MSKRTISVRWCVWENSKWTPAVPTRTSYRRTPQYPMFLSLSLCSVRLKEYTKIKFLWFYTLRCHSTMQLCFLHSHTYIIYLYIYIYISYQILSSMDATVYNYVRFIFILFSNLHVLRLCFCSYRYCCCVIVNRYRVIVLSNLSELAKKLATYNA